MVFAQEQIGLLHFNRAAKVTRAEQERAPFTAVSEVTEIDEPGHDERPHQREVPIQCAGQPAAEPAPARKRDVIERIDVKRSVAVTESRVSLVDLQSAGD